MALAEGRGVTDEVTVHFPMLVYQSGEVRPEHAGAFMRAMKRAGMLGTMKAPRRVFCEFSREKRRRTLPQNARWYGLLVPLFSEWTGYEKDEAHEELLRMFGPRKTVTWGDGTLHSIPKRSSEWTVEEATETQDRVERFLSMPMTDQIRTMEGHSVSGCGLRIPADERGVA